MGGGRMSRFDFGRSRPQPEPERVQVEPRVQRRLERQQRIMELKAAGVYREVFFRSDTRSTKPIALTERDVRVLSFIASVHVAPVDVLAKRFFDAHPQTGKKNTNPERACVRRLDELARAGYLVGSTVADSPSKERGGRVYALGRAGGAALGEPLRGVTPKRMHHHVQTLRHVELIREELAAQGKTIAKLELERGERASSERCAGNHIPDAILTLDDGATIAVEYVSTNYSDETIAMKGNHFASAYSQVRWSANSVATRNRVLRIMRDACDVIR